MFAATFASPRAQAVAPRQPAPASVRQPARGNQAALRQLGIQAKLTIGEVNDPLEHEADRAADQVMRAATPPSLSSFDACSTGAQRKIQRRALRPDEMFDSLAPAPTGPAEPGPAAPAQEEKKLQPAALGPANAGAVTPHYQQSLHSAVARGGAPLPAATRNFMEPRFGRELNHVRVHDGAEANGLARQINARAFTLGSDIFFAQSQYAPASEPGRHLLAHELAHVLQQSDGRVSRKIQRTHCNAYPAYDASIDRLTYNCAGLALRSYHFTSPPAAVYAEMAREFTNPNCPAANCQPNAIKFWLWKYDIRMEDDLGTLLRPTWQDFHIVGGRMNATGADPSNVYSKNGPRPIHGPGTGPSFRPAARERALDQDDHPGDSDQGRPAFKIRSNIQEEVSCAGCV